MYLTDEIMIEAKILNYANPVGVAVVSLTNKSTGKIIAQGRHTMYYWSKLQVSAFNFPIATIQGNNPTESWFSFNIHTNHH